MTDARRKLLLNAFKLFDLGLMVLAFIVAALAVLHQSRDVNATDFFSMRVKIQNIVIFSLLVLGIGLGTGLVAYYVGLPAGAFAPRGGPPERVGR